MEERDVLTLTLTDHADERVRRLGFDLSGPHLELCWGPMLSRLDCLEGQSTASPDRSIAPTQALGR